MKTHTVIVEMVVAAEDDVVVDQALLQEHMNTREDTDIPIDEEGALRMVRAKVISHSPRE